MTIKHFRPALNGFNRQDVVQYIEFLNNQHNAQIEQLNNQLQTALAQGQPAQNADLLAQLEAAQAKIAELEAALAKAPTADANELEVYRRAERTERLARERAAQIYSQANAVLSDATSKVDSAAVEIGAVVDQMAGYMQAAQDSVSSTKGILQDAAATLSAIRSEE